jgi:hypothetical protein
MVDIGVAADEEKIQLGPAAFLHLPPVHGKETRSGNGRDVHRGESVHFSIPT